MQVSNLRYSRLQIDYKSALRFVRWGRRTPLLGAKRIGVGNHLIVGSDDWRACDGLPCRWRWLRVFPFIAMTGSSC